MLNEQALMTIPKATTQEAGLLPSMGTFGDCFEIAMVEFGSARMRVELPTAKLANPIGLVNAIYTVPQGLPRRGSESLVWVVPHPSALSRMRCSVIASSSQSRVVLPVVS